jgi:hypothetical protein
MWEGARAIVDTKIFRRTIQWTDARVTSAWLNVCQFIEISVYYIFWQHTQCIIVFTCRTIWSFFFYIVQSRWQPLFFEDNWTIKLSRQMAWELILQYKVCYLLDTQSEIPMTHIRSFSIFKIEFWFISEGDHSVYILF